MNQGSKEAANIKKQNQICDGEMRSRLVCEIIGFVNRKLNLG